LLSYLRRIAVYQVLGTEGDAVEDDEAIKSLARRISAEDCQLYYQIGVIGRRDLPLAPDPQIGFEMVLLRMLAFTPAQVRGAAAPAPEDAPTASAAPATASQAPSASPVTAPSAEEWPELIEELRLTGLVRELALNCAFVEYRDRVLSLSVAPQFERLHNKKSEQRLQEALRGRYGAGLRLRIQASAEALHSSPSAQSAAQERARQRQAELLIESDDTVRALRETFGARVEDVSIR
jgi:DNA polymerase-3 subunit gamma/tau